MNPRLLPVSIVLLLFVMIAIASRFMSPIYATAVAIAGGVAFVGIAKPRFLITMAWLWYGTAPTLAPYYQGTPLQYVDEAFMLAFVGVMLVSGAMHAENVTKSLPINRGMLLLVLVIIMSSIYNGWETIRLVHYSKSYLLFYFIFRTTHAYCNTSADRNAFLRAILVFFLANVVLNVGWWLRINPITNLRQYSVDFSIGTLGYCNYVAYLSIIIIFIAVARLLNGGKQQIWSALLIVLSLAQLYFTVSAHAYPLLVVGLFVQFAWILRFRHAIRAAIPLLLCVGVLMAAFALTKDASDFNIARNYSDARTRERIWKRFTEGPKVEMYKDAFYRIPSEKPLRWFLGAGPGRYMSAVALVRPTDFAIRWLGAWYLTHSGREAMSSRSVITNPINGMCAIFGELGILGFALYVGIHVVAARRVLVQLRNHRYCEKAQLIIAMAFVPYMVIYLLINALLDLWAFEWFTSTLWIMAAMVWEPATSSGDAVNGDTPVSKVMFPT